MFKIFLDTLLIVSRLFSFPPFYEKYRRLPLNGTKKNRIKNLDTVSLSKLSQSKLSQNKLKDEKNGITGITISGTANHVKTNKIELMYGLTINFTVTKSPHGPASSPKISPCE